MRHGATQDTYTGEPDPQAMLLPSKAHLISVSIKPLALHEKAAVGHGAVFMDDCYGTATR